jgi:type I restriction enzyme, S subunit
MSEPWLLVPLSEVLTHRKEFVQIDDLQSYKRCRVQLHVQGIVLRDMIPGAEIKTKKQQVCRAGEFLVAEIDAKVGGYGVVPNELAGAIVSSHYFLFAVNGDRLDRRFLACYIRTAAFRDQVRAQGSTNYAAIRPEDVLRYVIPLPPLAEQRRIVAHVEALAQHIADAKRLREEASGLADALVKSEMRSIFCGDGQAPVVQLEALCAAIIDNLHSNPQYADEGVPCVRSPDVTWGRLNLRSALKTCEEEYVRRTARGEPAVDDIVFVREGGGTGKAAIVEPGQRFSLGQRVMMLRPDKSKVIPKFLLYQMLSPTVYEDQLLPLITGSASPHLNISALRRFNLTVPSLTDQGRIVGHLDMVWAAVNALRSLQDETGTELDALLPSILSQAFSGKL